MFGSADWPGEDMVIGRISIFPPISKRGRIRPEKSGILRRKAYQLLRNPCQEIKYRTHIVCATIAGLPQDGLLGCKVWEDLPNQIADLARYCMRHDAQPLGLT